MICKRYTGFTFKSPAIALSGMVDYEMYTKFRTQFDNASDQTTVVVIELSTLGGDPEVARMMGEDVRFASETEPARRFVFLGKAAIYSAGTTFMSFFCKTKPLPHAGHAANDTLAEAIEEAHAMNWPLDDLHRGGKGNLERN